MHVWDDLLFIVWYCDAAAVFVRELKFSGKEPCLVMKEEFVSNTLDRRWLCTIGILAGFSLSKTPLLHAHLFVPQNLVLS